MKRALSIALDTAHALALAVWLGGLVAVFGDVAPVTFAALDKPHAAALVAGELRGLGTCVEIAGIMMIGVQFLTRRRYQRDRQTLVGDGVRQLLTFGALFLAEFDRYSAYPAMTAAQSAGRGASFRHLYGTASLLALAQIPLLIAIVALTTWLTWPSPHPRPLPRTRETAD